MPVLPDPLDRSDLRARVQAVVDAEIAHQRSVLAPVGADLDPLVDAVAHLLVGGKRLRAGFLYWGYRLAGRPDSDALVRMATAMELFQAAALLHDDVMDRSDTRRGRPTAHRALAARHREAGWSGPSDRFGEGGAILAGDLCLQWTDELVATCGLPPQDVARARTTFDTMRTQLMGGQYLDLLESARGWDGLDLDARIASVRRVVRFKSAKYTIEHPLLIGATAGGLPAPVLDALSRYGLALGEAFQLRDDVLGVFGDPARTGKPAGDDLREGKRTLLVAHALDRADTDQAALVDKLLGRPDLDDAGVAELRDVLRATGAVDAVEADITDLAAQAAAVVDELRQGPAALDDEALQVLRDLVAVCTARDT
ncbi:polyprenyl synthetase family protein [Lapillicoccus jejuensis]|uniref:Geranylgeranyl diphosphate synthase type I n=1 Tax=Lapillicoccus jejuensis TaxID=402171 RepID=A0A542E5K6_9MICO|nr:geranylgeranyl diphosphate synthase type I [Lapillicoccus jejuensis]